MLMLYGPSCVESVRGRVVYTAVTHACLGLVGREESEGKVLLVVREVNL